MKNLTFWFCFGLAMRNHVTSLKPRDHLALQGARCTSRCLQEFVENEQDSGKKELKLEITELNETTYDACLASTACFECLQPCSKHFSSLPACLAFCKENLFCIYSCAFFNDIKGKKMGSCTAPTVAQNFTDETLTSQFSSKPSNQESCSKQCKNDFDCQSNEKCCRAGCGYSCLPSLIKKSSLPPMLNSSYFDIEEHQSSSVVLSWRPNKEIKPWTLFVVQEKKYLSLTIPVRFKSSWQTLRQTPDSRIAMVHLKRGFWYKFRVAAVNVNGTRGFATCLASFRLTTKPRRPPAPIDVIQVSQRVTGGARYNVMIQWRLPRDVASDLPIKGFQITWVALSKSGRKMRHTTQRRYVKASKHTWRYGRKFWLTWIHKLRFNAVFNVSVVTSSGWTNYSVYSQESRLQVLFPPMFPKQEVTDLKVNLPFHVENKIAAVNISWNFDYTEAPKNVVMFYVEWWTVNCVTEAFNIMSSQEIVKALSIRIQNLVLNCRYRLSVQAMYGSFRHQWSAKKRFEFDTPPCGITERRIATTSSAACSKHASDLYAPRDLEARGPVATSSVMSVELRWRPPVMSRETYGGQPQMVGYFLYILNNAQPDIMWKNIKSKMHPRLKLKLPIPNAWYTFRLAAINYDGVAGQEAFVAFRTQSARFPNRSLLHSLQEYVY